MRNVTRHYVRRIGRLPVNIVKKVKKYSVPWKTAKVVEVYKGKELFYQLSSIAAIPQKGVRSYPKCLTVLHDKKYNKGRSILICMV